MKKKTAIITGLTITGIATLIGTGVVLKRRKKKGKALTEKIICDYDEMHNKNRLNPNQETEKEEEVAPRRWIKLK